MPESLLTCAARPSTTIGSPSQASLEASPCEHRQDRVTISGLPNDVLVEIFHFYVNDRTITASGWHTLVHVCQNWRYIVFASPRRLNLRLFYTGKRPMSEMLDVWPVLPVVLSQPHASWGVSKSCLDSWGNVAGALESEHHHRICQIHLFDIPTSRWERLAAAMEKPFPELIFLRFGIEDNTATSLPDSFFAPLVQHLSLSNCPLRGIPKLLLSSDQLVVLSLFNIPNSGYNSPEDLGTALSVMSRLESLRLQFQSPLYPASRPPPGFTPCVLPALTEFVFCGVHEYLEDLLAQLEAPLLKSLQTTFFMDLDFVIPQLHQLIDRTESFKTCDRATVRTSDRAIRLSIFSQTNRLPELLLEIRCRKLDWQLSSLAQVCTSSFPLLSTLARLEIEDDAPQSHWKVDMDPTQWVELLDPFTSVKDLLLYEQVTRHVFPALEEIAEEREREVLPALHNIFLRDLELSESVPKYIEGFVVARKLSGHPVAVYPWESRRDYDVL